jgi:superfamily I DNA/RNA helicase
VVECRNEVCEVQRVVEDIVQRAAQEETRYGDVAILFRTNRTGKEFQAELQRRQVKTQTHVAAATRDSCTAG